MDEERKPCGLGCAYSEREMYFGNFFEGVLEHYGRMMGTLETAILMIL